MALDARISKQISWMLSVVKRTFFMFAEFFKRGNNSKKSSQIVLAGCVWLVTSGSKETQRGTASIKELQ